VSGGSEASFGLSLPGTWDDKTTKAGIEPKKGMGLERVSKMPLEVFWWKSRPLGLRLSA
jgi:hypothetical protein